VSSLPSGHYDLRIDILSSESGEPVATSQAPFDVLWDVDSWRSDAADLMDVTAQALLTQEQAYGFRLLTRGEKEARITDLWRSIDPTPDTGRERAAPRLPRARGLRQRALQRVREGHVQRPRPDLDPVRGAGRRSNRAASGLGSDAGLRRGRADPKTSKDLLTKPDTGVVDTRPYEIWTYNLRGHEMVPRHRMNEVSAG